MLNKKSNLDFTFPITIRECVALGKSVKMKPFQRLNAQDWKDVDEAIEEVGLTELAHRPIGALSGGQFQRVLLARCLVQKADYIFFDGFIYIFPILKRLNAEMVSFLQFSLMLRTHEL